MRARLVLLGVALFALFAGIAVGRQPVIRGAGYGDNSLAADVAVDSVGTLFILDVVPSRVRRVTVEGAVTIVAGTGLQGFGGDGGAAASAQLRNPTNLAVDPAGNLYIGDTGNHRIRKVTPAGVISTVAGNGTQGFAGDGGPATAAQLFAPRVEVDAVGNLFIADTGNNRIRKVTPGGIISTIAGDGTRGSGGDGGPAISAQLDSPRIGAVDRTGNLFVTSAGRIRKISASGIISTVAGTGTRAFSGDNGPATAAQLANAIDVAVDGTGTLFIADSMNNRIRKVSPSGIISTAAGTGTTGFSGDGGPAVAAQMALPGGVALDRVGNLFIADFGNRRVRKINPAGVISTVVTGDGRGSSR